MTVWMISVNSNVYNHQAAFERWGTVDWIQSANYEIGDIIYIYESRQAARIRYKTEVVLNNIPYSEKLDDEAFWHDDRGLARQNLKYSRLKLLKVIDSKELTLYKLRQHGLKNAPQLAKKLDGELLEYIEANEGNLNDVKVNYSFKPELIGSHLDGNIAIKCNYCDGGKDEYHIGFSGVCSDNVIKHNIEKEHRVWCSNERCPCYQYHEGLITRSILNEIMSTSSELVCYESLMLAEWKAQAGLSETGQTRKFGSTLHKGAACVFTTRLPDMPEKDRVVWGLFIIDELFRGDSQESGYVKCNTEYHIELTPSEAKQIKYWKYYRNKNNPNVEQWGTGLYRFMSNDGVIAMLVDLISITSNERREEVIRFLTEYCRLNNRKMPEVETAYRVNNIEEKSIVSFPVGGTYDLVASTNVHAHPLKNGYPSKVHQYLMVRATGGVSDYLYEVLDTIDLNPMDQVSVERLPGKYNSVVAYINKRKADFGFTRAPLPYRFYMLKPIHSFTPPFVMDPNPQGFRYLSFSEVGLDINRIERACKNVVITRDNFIENLILPTGFEAKQYDGMNRVHFKYWGIGFLVIDMKLDGYNLGSRESYMKSIGVIHYELTDNLGPNHALVRDIPYSDTTILYKLLEYVSNESIKDDFEKQQLELEDKSIEETVENNNLVGMDRVAVVKTRVNQGVFRDRLIRKYNKCCICGVDDVNLLVASHIKPWVDSEPDERVDDNNGLLLCPNHDRLFDRGYISFDDAGNILISKALSETNQIYLNVNPDSSIELSEKSRPYMKYHRENIFLDKVIESKKEESTQVEIDNSESAAEPITDKPSNNASFGALPNCLLNRDVKDINNKRIGKIINIDGFYLRVKFYDDSKTKDFVFPQCFMKNRLSVRDESLRKYLDEYLEDFV